MPTELQIIRAKEFIRVGARRRLDLDASRELLRELARACWRRGINQALLDLRELQAPGPTPMLTPDDVASLVNAFCEIGFSDRLRLALLYTADPYHRARLFALMSNLRGWKVKASDNFEESLLWLSKGEAAEDRADAGEKKVPIHGTKTTAVSPGLAGIRVEAGHSTKSHPIPDCRPSRSTASAKASTKRNRADGRAQA